MGMSWEVSRVGDAEGGRGGGSRYGRLGGLRKTGKM
jgi:hypothetical protein